MTMQVGIALWFIAASPGAPRAGQTSPAPSPAIGTQAPDFTLPDAYTGVERSLREFSCAKRPVALFFFCGCPACHAVATGWATYQRGNALPKNAATVIVYSTTDRPEAKARVAASGLDPKHTAVLCDTDALAVTVRLYHADHCPRIFVTDRTGKIIHASAGAGERPQETRADLLVAGALSALESAIATTDSEPK